MKTAARNIIVITLITLIAGFFLGYVYDITKEPIAFQQQQTKQEAYKAVFPDAVSFAESDTYDLESLNGYLAENGFGFDKVDEIIIASGSDNSALGYVYGLTTSEGYGGDISISMGIANDGTVKGIEILKISETAGLGMKADTPEFKAQFENKNVSRFSYTKTGKAADYEIDALSGATITTNALTNLVNSGIAVFEKIGGAE